MIHRFAITRFGRRLLAPLAALLLAAEVAAAPDPRAQPSVADVIDAVVLVAASVPATARTAETLGARRSGNGVVIDSDGLVLTIGYLIVEAERVEIGLPSGEIVPAKVVAYDHDTGFGMVRAERPLNRKPLRFGNSSAVETGSRALVLTFGSNPVMPAYVIGRRTYAGYWEYLLDDALFTAPAHPRFGGAALVGEDGRLLGIGSLFVNVGADLGQMIPGNMFVPIDALKPIFADMIEKGRPATPPRPWLGINTDETSGKVVITRVTAGGPAEKAGLKPGDVIVGVGGKRVQDMADLLRKIWAQGKPGDRIPLDVVHPGSADLSVDRLDVPAISRYDFLKLPDRP